ncbi:putative TRAF-like signal transducer [Aspergillus glaucus CBS 516.65]|uniref:RING-type domain-containing protein n=1 Tax=Aspergillus glaucus CBS 516.65 TaxID=1160497 RepID=A0A1L9VXE5_ASPGL|nr:hypothetical protein ASPGLDRAFT_63434 [Aspergillus glaucus CBS 516.65]OJJ88575.1 hypothetical protein ASPGLDRAFT_63434 [Aspergillus glaucus CBS 516.65]
MDLEELLLVESSCTDDEIVDLRALDYVSGYDTHLMCPICHCALIRPVRLQCDHVFCQKCLGSAVTSSSGRDDFTCPTCRTPTQTVYTDVPRLLINMCDDLRVKCPFLGEGCTEIMARGHVESHVDKYCGYKLLDCPSETCDKKTRKKDLDSDGKCVHELLQCSHCEEEVMEQDYESCLRFETMCPHCQVMTLQKDLREHIDACPDAIHSCTASKYGCPVKIKRADIVMHEQACPLIAMGPYFEAQNTRLDSLELTMRHLQQRNEIFEDGFANIRSTLVDASRATPGQTNRDILVEGQTGSSDSQEVSSDGSQSNNPTTYLLSLHESLREEVGQLSHAITDLDARASMAIMNECLRIKEDMAHTNAAVNSMRMQVQWLMNPRLHQGERTSSVRANDTNDSRTGQLGSSTASATSASPIPGPSNTSRPGFRPRRLSDSAREGTKL